jgi:hypothetical protein
MSDCVAAPVHLPGVYCFGRLPSARHPLILINVLQGTVTADSNIVTFLNVTQAHVQLAKSMHNPVHIERLQECANIQAPIVIMQLL